ncbi:AMP-binding protein, partial [Saezia sanguinis]
IVQIDPDYPAKRIEHMVADSDARVVITLDALRDRLPDTAPVLILDDPATRQGCAVSDDGPVTDTDRLRPLRVADLAYITYTSGSTGTPKG